MADKYELLPGTLDLLVLKTLDAMGPLHGYGIARRIEQLSQEVPLIPAHHDHEATLGVMAQIVLIPCPVRGDRVHAKKRLGIAPLDAWTKLAHALFQSNEAMFYQ